LAANSPQQPEQRVAARGIALRQYGQSLLGAAASTFLRLFICLIIKKTTNAIIRKLITSFRKAPYVITGKPFALASARLAG